MMRTRRFSRAVASLPAFVLSLGVALGSPLVGPLFATDAAASVSIAATWDGLLQQSSTAAIVTAVESKPVWENGRIYTYTHVHVDQGVAGELGTGGETWIRTMGGVVGNVGQQVEGEAAFAPGDSSLLFLRPGPPGSYVVTARGQGQFPVVRDTPTAPPRVVRSSSVGMLVPPRATAAGAPRLAADVMHGRLVDDVVKDIVAAWGASHAH